MIGGMVMVFVALWIYQSAMKANLNNVIYWVAASAIAFYVAQFLLVEVNIYILESFRASEGGAGYEGIHGADRKNQGDFIGFVGILKSVYLELTPPIISFIGIAFLRLKFITKESFSVGALFGGIKEMFQSVKHSFKAPE